MRGRYITQAEQRVIVQTTGEVCLVRGERVSFEISVPLTGLTCCQRMMVTVSFPQQHRSSFRPKRLVSRR